jgi:predicted phage-related endonuclease
MEALKQTLMLDLGEYDTGLCDKYKVTWKNQTRSMFDVKRFAEDNPDMDLSDYYNVSTSRIFKIKEF